MTHTITHTIKQSYNHIVSQRVRFSQSQKRDGTVGVKQNTIAQHHNITTQEIQYNTIQIRYTEKIGVKGNTWNIIQRNNI